MDSSKERRRVERKIRKKSSRRGFIKGVLATTSAGFGVYTWNEYEKNQTAPQIISIESLSTTTPVPLPTPIPVQITDNSDLLKELAELRAENSRLQSELSDASEHSITLEDSVRDSQASAEGWQEKVATATQEITLLHGLLALYEELEDADIGTVVQNGLTTVGSTLTELTDNIPAIREQLGTTATLFNQLEAEIPTIDEGRRWLYTHLSKLDGAYEKVEKLLSAVVNTTADFFAMIKDWSDTVLKWLPFGIGEKSSQLIQGMGDAIAELPITSQGASVQLLDPLFGWFGEYDSAEYPLITQLITPARTQQLSIEQNLLQAEGVQQKIQVEIDEKMQQAIQLHQNKLADIATYKQSNQLQTFRISDQQTV